MKTPEDHFEEFKKSLPFALGYEGLEECPVMRYAWLAFRAGYRARHLAALRSAVTGEKIPSLPALGDHPAMSEEGKGV